DDLARAKITSQQLHNQLPTTVRHLLFTWVGRWHTSAAHGGDAEHLKGNGHSIRRKLPAAGPGTRTGMALQVVEFRRSHFPSRIRPYTFKHVLNGHISALKPPRHNRAAIEHEGGDIEARQAH